MITYLQNDEDYIYSFIEWDILNNHWKQDRDGEYLFIRNLWIHKDYRNKNIINLLINILNLDIRTRGVKYVYWQRNNNRISRLFGRDRYGNRRNRSSTAEKY